LRVAPSPQVVEPSGLSPDAAAASCIEANGLAFA
jgi:hypothetical protein